MDPQQPNPQQPQPPFTPESPVSPPQSQPQFQQEPLVQPNVHFPANHPEPLTTKPTGEDPGKTLGIVGFVLVFVGLGLVSVILGIIALKKSKQAGRKNGFAIAAIILGILEIIAAIAIVGLLIMLAATVVDTCSELGTGTHTLLSGQTITCNL